MDLEFQESEIIFCDQSHQIGDCDGMNYYSVHDQNSGESSRRVHSKSKKSRKAKKAMAIRTVPISVPCRILSRSEGNSSGWFSDDDEDPGDEEMVPPHVILGRRVAGKMAFSVCSGNGRTLKGRDLRQVRNSILRLTGFLES